MKIQCPTCQQVIPPHQVHMANDLAFCTSCNEQFSIAKMLEYKSVNENVLYSPPKGAWFRREGNKVILGASLRSANTFALLLFAIIWTAMTFGILILPQLFMQRFNFGASCAGILFLGISFFIWRSVIQSLWGKVEVTLHQTNSSIFTGWGLVSKTQPFDWWAIESIREREMRVGRNGGHLTYIVLKGKEWIQFGESLPHERRYFLFNALRYLKTRSHT